jgi:type IV secretory pathway VirB10-like protein
MGRHSAPDEVDDDAVEIDSPLAVLDLGEDRGRHASADDEAEGDSVASADRGTSDQATAEFDEAHTQRLAVVDAPPLETPTKSDTKADKKAAKASAKAAKQAEKAAKADRTAGQQADRKADRKAQRGESDTRADLRMLREQPAVRAQVIGAVIASFLIYTLVMLALGRTDKYLLWLWVPIVACGVLVGLVLDLAHRRARKRGGPIG